MIKAGIKKELRLLTRTGKLIGIIAVILAFALSDPLIMKITKSMMDAMPEMYESMGQAEETVNALSQMASLFSDLSPAALASQCATELAGTGSIILMFVFMSAAGGEQKKRSVIIPQCSGLTPTMYVAPKFIVYTLLVFVCSFVSMFAGTGLSLLLFEGTVDFSLIAVSALSVSFFMSFMTVFQLTVGLSTGMPGIAVISSIGASTLIPSMLSMFGVDRFNPFSLRTLAYNAAILSGGAHAEGTGLGSVLENTMNGKSFDMFDFAVSTIVTVIISVMLYFTTVFTLSAKELKNEGDDPVL